MHFSNFSLITIFDRKSWWHSDENNVNQNSFITLLAWRGVILRLYLRFVYIFIFSDFYLMHLFSNILAKDENSRKSQELIVVDKIFVLNPDKVQLMGFF